VTNTLNCHLQIVFETGLDLDTQELILAGYQRVSARVAASLLPTADGRGTISAAPGGLAISARTRRGSPLVPAWFTDLPLPFPTTSSDEVSAEVALNVDRCTLRFFDYGVAIALLDGQVTMTDQTKTPTTPEFVRSVELFSDTLPSHLIEVAAAKVAELRAAVLAVKGSLVLDDLLDREMRETRGLAGSSRVNALWVHRILALPQLPSDDEFRHLTAVKRGQTVTFESDDRGTFHFYPGQGTSLVVSDSAQIPAEIVEPLALLNAYYAGSTKYDEAVFSGISQLQAISRGRGRYGARAKADEILAMQERVLLFRATVDHQAHNLSPQEQSVWQRTSAAWNLQPLIDGVASNAATLDRLFQHVAESRRFEQAQRLSFIIVIFTAASILGVAAALFPIVDQEPAHLPVLQRILVFTALVFIPLVTIGFVSMLIWQARRVRK